MLDMTKYIKTDEGIVVKQHHHRMRTDATYARGLAV
jgi:hypothetical protein